MLKKITFFVFLISFTACTELTNFGTAVLDSMAGGLTDEEVSGGLKEALEQGILKGADIVSVTDGFYKNAAIKVLFPEDAQKVMDVVSKVPGGDVLIDKFVLSLNRAAEDAAKGAKPIFVNAIKQLTFQDVMDILLGGNNLAATQFLERTTSQPLYDAFYPVVNQSLSKVKVPEAWEAVTNVYNRIPFQDPVTTDINKYVCDKALAGLFHMVGKEEQNIRKDPFARTTDLMKKVFAAQDNK
ncbi:MAG: DUF4197 domain-containing protein [Bacteroidota bacterium]